MILYNRKYRHLDRRIYTRKGRKRMEGVRAVRDEIALA